MKNKIYAWIWKWHFIGGLISAPIVILLAITGIVYLFKDNYEADSKAELKKVIRTEKRITYQQQWEIAKKEWDRVPSGFVIPQSDNEASEFISGKFSHKSSLYIDPYQTKVNGAVIQNQTDMHAVRKLHGELLMGSFGTKIVELVGSWMVVLIITGIFLFWPRQRGIKGLFTFRTSSRRLLMIDLHGIIGFWSSFVLLLILTGGLPWTDIFGTSFKWMQDQTHTGYPATWDGRTFMSDSTGTPLTLDAVVEKAKAMNLEGRISLDLPSSGSSVYSIYNEPLDFDNTRKIHIDQYSGEVLKIHTWEDIGIMMKARIWAMAFHQGELGLWNWLLVLIAAFGLMSLSIFGVLAYLMRKRKGSWGVPAIPAHAKPGMAILFIVILLGVLLPLFGLSVLIIFIIEKIKDTTAKVLSLNPS